MKKLDFQSATIPYLGSKKRQCSTLASFIDPEKHKTLVSPFAGGCSFELYAKRKLSMRIFSNDWSLVSFVSQKALLENNGARISPNDIYSLFKENENSGFVSENYSKFFTDEICGFLDTASENIRRLPEGYKKHLLSHLLVFYILHILPYGKFGCTSDIRNVKARGMETALAEAARTSDSRASKLLKSVQHPLPILKKLAERINAAVTNNNENNKAYCEDAFEFLPRTKDFGKESVMLADPPYFESTSYDMYRPINEIILGRKEKKQDSVFNGKEVEAWFERFFNECQHIDLWLITYGAKIDEPNAIHSEEFLKMVKKHRPKAKLLKLENFTWSINSLSGKSPRECEEFIVIAEK
ncbi:MAG: DNA adenine methylase [Candidatus Moranbacteria bacterium]|nr:DNA adenine methylase [Candidatus Moranbacteria bacterium]